MHNAPILYTLSSVHVSCMDPCMLMTWPPAQVLHETRDGYTYYVHFELTQNGEVK